MNNTVPCVAGFIIGSVPKKADAWLAAAAAAQIVRCSLALSRDEARRFSQSTLRFHGGTTRDAFRVRALQFAAS